jgi:FixJ family two-component response regulator
MSVAPTVCVVDDDAALLRALGRLLRSAGYTVETFGNAEDFLAAGHSPPPDCLVVDVQLGASSGFALHHRLRSAGLSIPTIFITAYDDAPIREQAQRIGAAGYILKPFDDTSLVSAIEASLHRP